MKGKKTVYFIQGFESMSQDGHLHDVAVFEIYASSEEQALKTARGYTTLPKKFYRVDRVIETYK